MIKKETINQILELYKKKYSYEYIGKKTGVCASTVGLCVKKHQINEFTGIMPQDFRTLIKFIDMENNILALDIATKTGWKTRHSSGTWDLKPNRGESEGMRVVRFKSKVKEVIQSESINVIAYERPAGMHKSSIMVASEMVGVLKDLCIELGISLACYSASEIKKFATGKGNANKDAMVKAAKLLGFAPRDDNEADAIHLYNMVSNEIY